MNTTWLNSNPTTYQDETWERLALGRLVEPRRRWRSSLEIARDVRRLATLRR